MNNDNIRRMMNARRPASKKVASAGRHRGRSAELAALGVELSEHHAYLSRYIARRISNSQDAEDYTQEVYLRVLDSTLPSQKIDSWRGILSRVASRVIVDRFRHDQARRRNAHEPAEDGDSRLVDSTANPEADAGNRQQLSQIYSVLDSLDPICRDAFLMARVEGFSHKEVAAQLGIEPVSVGRNIEKALATLARKGLAVDG